MCEYVALTEKEKSPISLYSKIYFSISDDFESENHETINGENKVIKTFNKYNKTPIFVRDRGYDANEFFKKDIKEDNKFVTRLRGNRHLLFKGNRKLVGKIAESRKGKISTKLIYKGENKECSISYTRVELPVCDWKEITLVTIHNLSEEETMMLLTITLTYVSILVEKIDKNFYSNLIIERARALKEKAIIYMEIMVSGIKEILRYARTGIREWKNIETRERYKQLELKI